MLVGRIKDATRNLGKPEGWDDERDGPCSSLPIRDGRSQGVPHMESAWYPTIEEMQRMVMGAPVYLRVVGTNHPPVALWVGDTPEQVDRKALNLESPPPVTIVRWENGPWLPIEDAPKDQTAILATHEDNRLGVQHVCWRIEPGSPDYLNPRTGDTWRPTHWRHLPQSVRAMRAAAKKESDR